MTCSRQVGQIIKSVFNIRPMTLSQWFTQGENAIGAILGTGWYCGNVGQLGKERYGDNPYFLLQLHLEYEDGSELTVVTDETWQATKGPLLYSDIIMGESYDPGCISRIGIKLVSRVINGKNVFV
jgi:hypothetical protein